MAQFGGNKNPPWAQGGRTGPPGGGAAGGAIDVPGLVGAFGAAAGQAGPPVFHQGGAGIPPGLGVGHLGVPGPGHPGPAVTLAAMASQPGVYPRALGPGGFPGGPLIPQQQPQPQVMLQQAPPPQQQQPPPPQQQQQQGQQQQTAASQRVFTGTVTKLHDNFGFVDEDVFFQTSVVKGQTPRVNDRVLVEAAYNASMPFKWNATRIQVLPNQNARQGPNAGPGGQTNASLPTSVSSVTTTSTLNAHAFANTAQPPPVQMSHPPPPRNTQPRNEAAFGGGPPPNSGPGNQNQTGRGDHRNDRGGGGGGGGGMNRNNSSPLRGSDSMKNRGGMPSSSRDHGSRRDDRNNTRDRSGGNDRESHNIRDRSRDKERSLSSRSSPPPPPTRKRSRSPRRTRSRSRSRSPPRRRARTAPRYNVSVPKVSLNFPESGVFDLKKRYTNMYIPSDYFMANHSWMKSFPVHDGFKIQYASTFHVFNKDQVESPILSDAVFDPADADHSFSAKVMLMALPPPDVLIEKTCQLAESSATNRDNLVHPTRAIQFLVGTRGKNETLAIGGPWSPSLDGPNPESDPSVLIRTAIRVCRALTGIDLTNCTQWHRFLEIHYRRQESSSKPARTETTVIFLPDIWSVMPTSNEHVEVKTLYEMALDAKINPPPPKPEVEEPSTSGEAVLEPEPEMEPAAVDDKKEENKESNTANNDEESAQKELKENVPEVEDQAEDTEKEQEVEEDEDKVEATPGDDLDVKSMKVNELREELTARGLNSKGLKSQLQERLQEALENEKGKENDAEQAMETEQSETSEKIPTEDVAQEDKKEAPETSKEEDNKKPEGESETVMEVDNNKVDNPVDNKPVTPVKAPVAPVLKKPEPPKPQPVKELDEKQKSLLKSAYKFPSEPSILVHPHPKAKSGKFDCTVMSLSVLLDYRTEDNKENTFEVSLFAELFNEMLMRDSGFRLYKSVLQAASTADAEKHSHSKSSSIEPSEEKDVKKEEGGSSNEDSTSSREKESKNLKVTKDRDLLLACSYFDLGHCGYFETKDLEDILTTINLNLSRAQVKKLVSKVTSGKDQQVNYRQFTDGDAGSEKIKNKVEEEDPNHDKTLGQGFKAFVPNPKQEEASAVNTSNIADGICSYRGSVVDVGKLLGQLKRSEKARSDTESQLKSAQKTVQDLKEASEKHSSVKDRLQSEVKDLRKQLKRVEDDMKRSQTDSSKYYTILKDIHSKVHPAVNAPTSPSPTKEGHTIKKEESEDQTATVNGKSEPAD